MPPFFTYFLYVQLITSPAQRRWTRTSGRMQGKGCDATQSPMQFVRRRVPASITQRLSCQGRLIQTP